MRASAHYYKHNNDIKRGVHSSLSVHAFPQAIVSTSNPLIKTCDQTATTLVKPLKPLCQQSELPYGITTNFSQRVIIVNQNYLLVQCQHQLIKKWLPSPRPYFHNSNYPACLLKTNKPCWPHNWVPEQGFLSSKNLDSWSWIFCQVGQTASMRNQTSSNLKEKKKAHHTKKIYRRYCCHNLWTIRTDFEWRNIYH